MTTVLDSTSRKTAARPLLRAWLLFLALLVFAMVLVGGATRLTESGLSITEWQPVTGVIPPFTEEAWQEEFDKYRQIPQYTQINRGMSLDAFRTIYWWEWSHRFLGRLVGVAFLLPFLWFLLTERLERRLVPWLLGAFALGGLQGALGWYMVASGLVDRVSVSHYRLAAHLTLAVVILAYLLWLAERLRPRAPSAALPGRIPATAFALTVLVLGQVALGALVAGLDAGLTHATWPLMDGGFAPTGLLSLDPWWLNFGENVAAVQFAHRIAAYAIVVVAILHVVDCVRTAGEGEAAVRAGLIVLLVLVQAVLGIATLLSGVPMALALVHQAGAVVVLAAIVVHLARLLPHRHETAVLP